MRDGDESSSSLGQFELVVGSGSICSEVEGCSHDMALNAGEGHSVHLRARPDVALKSSHNCCGSLLIPRPQKSLDARKSCSTLNTCVISAQRLPIRHLSTFHTVAPRHASTRFDKSRHSRSNDLLGVRDGVSVLGSRDAVLEGGVVPVVVGWLLAVGVALLVVRDVIRGSPVGQVLL